MNELLNQSKNQLVNNVKYFPPLIIFFLKERESY